MEPPWTPLPYPWDECATPHPPAPLDFPALLERLLADAAGLAGVIAGAAGTPECDGCDLAYATRLLAEHLHATVALYGRWRQQDEA